MLLSVIVPVYNVAPWLERCLQSLCEQDLATTDHEIILIDDGSTDGSGRLADALAQSHPQVQVLHQPNQGLSAARNAGIAAARGRYVQFVDSDDYVTPNVLGTLVALMEEQGLDLLGFRQDIVQESVHEPPEPSARPSAAPGPVMTGIEYAADTYWLNSVTWYMIRRDFLVRTDVRFAIGRLVEDTLFTAELLAQAQRVSFVELVVYHYVMHPTSIMHDRGRERTRQMLRDYEFNVAGLGELRRRVAKSGTHPAYLARLATREQSFVFFLISRFIRSDISVLPDLRATIGRLRVIGAYPMDAFPGLDYPGPRYRLLTWVYNHPLLLIACTLAYRAFRRGTEMVNQVVPRLRAGLS